MRRRELMVGLAGAAAAVAGATPLGRPRVLGFALGSGAMHGWAHIGVARACRRLGITPQVIAGSSAGAIVGALWAGDLPERAMTDVATKLQWGSSGTWALSARGLKRNDMVREVVEQSLGGRTIERLPVRFAAVASDAMTGESVLLDRGPVGLAVAASSAVPVWFEPVRVAGRDLLDGSLTAPVPVDAARTLGATLLVAVDIAYRPYEEAPAGLSGLAFQSMHILTNALAREQTRRADLTIRLDLHHLMIERVVPEALIAAGEAAMFELAPALVQK